MEKAEKRGNKGGAAFVIRVVVILILSFALIVYGYLIYIKANY